MRHIRKLNKKLIYSCLMALAAIAIPLMILPLACQEKRGEKTREEKPTQALVPRDDAFAISGTAKFPSSYEGVKQFEHDNIKASVNDDMAVALAKLSGVDQAPAEIAPEPLYNHRHVENPWTEAQEQEHRRRAFDHYHARRASILFARENSSSEREAKKETDPVIGLLEKSLEMAQKHMDGGYEQSNQVFFKRHGQANNIGQLQQAPPYTLSEGTLIPTTLLTEINTDLPGPILARVTHNIWDSKTGKTLLVPQNSTLIGEYQSSIGHGQQRAQIVWSRIIFPNQQSVNLGAMVGLDKKGVSGASGQVDNHYDKVALGLIMTTSLGASVRMIQGKYDPHSATMAQEFGNSLASETMRLGNKITDKMLSIPPTIVVPMGKQLNVFVEQDLNFRPYQG
jgi:type IV secretory pathway VirB10-like protein